MMKPISRLPPLPDEIYADPGRHDWYFRERKQDSVASYIRADLHREAIAALEAKVAAADWLIEAAEKTANDMCEGFCQDLPTVDFTNADCERDCGGCKSRAALAAYRGAGK